MSAQVAHPSNLHSTMITMTANNNDLHDLINTRFNDLAKRILDELKQTKYSKEFFKALDMIILEPIESEFNKLHENTLSRLIDFKTKKLEAQQKQQQLLQKQYENIEQRQVSIESQLERFGSSLADTNIKSKQLEQQQLKLQQQQQQQQLRQPIESPVVAEDKQQQTATSKPKSAIPTSTILTAANSANVPAKNITVTQPIQNGVSNGTPTSSTGMYPVLRSASDNASALKRQSSLRQHQPRYGHNLVADIVAQRQQLDHQTSVANSVGSILKKSSSQTNASINPPTQVVSINDKPMTINHNAVSLAHTYNGEDADEDDDDEDDDEDDEDEEESSYGQLTSFPHRSSICVQKLNNNNSQSVTRKLKTPNDHNADEHLTAPSANRSKIARLDQQKRERQSNSVMRSNTLGASDTRTRFSQQNNTTTSNSNNSNKQHRQFKQPESSDQPRSMILSTKEMASLYKPHMNYSTSALGNYRLSDDDEIIIIPTNISPSLMGSASPDAMDQANADELSERFSISRTKSFWEKLSKGKENDKGAVSEHNNNNSNNHNNHNNNCHQQPIITSPSSSSVSPQPNSTSSYGRNSANGVSGSKNMQVMNGGQQQHQQQPRQQQRQLQQQLQPNSKNQLQQMDKGCKQMRHSAAATPADTHQLERMDSTGGSNSNYSCSSSGDEATSSGCVMGNVIMVNGNDTSPIKGGHRHRRHPQQTMTTHQQQQQQHQHDYPERTISKLQAEMLSRQNKFRQTR